MPGQYAGIDSAEMPVQFAPAPHLDMSAREGRVVHSASCAQVVYRSANQLANPGLASSAEHATPRASISPSNSCNAIRPSPLLSKWAKFSLSSCADIALMLQMSQCSDGLWIIGHIGKAGESRASYQTDPAARITGRKHMCENVPRPTIIKGISLGFRRCLQRTVSTT